MKMNSAVFFVAAAALFIASVFFIWGSPQSLIARFTQSVSPPADDIKIALASCLSEKGVVMYGAWWCPHCANQKKAFGDAFSEITSVECSSPGQRDRLPVCVDADIKGYPTWVFPDGSRLSGEQPLAELAKRAGCPYEK